MGESRWETRGEVELDEDMLDLEWSGEIRIVGCENIGRWDGVEWYTGELIFEWDEDKDNGFELNFELNFEGELVIELDMDEVGLEWSCSWLTEWDSLEFKNNLELSEGRSIEVRDNVLGRWTRGDEIGEDEDNVLDDEVEYGNLR